MTFPQLLNVKPYNELAKLQERAVNAYNTANNDGNVTRNDINKLKLQMQTKTSNCDSMKGQYANQMLKVSTLLIQSYKVMKFLIDGYKINVRINSNITTYIFMFYHLCRRMKLAIGSMASFCRVF